MLAIELLAKLFGEFECLLCCARDGISVRKRARFGIAACEPLEGEAPIILYARSRRLPGMGVVGLRSLLIAGNGLRTDLIR